MKKSPKGEKNRQDIVIIEQQTDNAFAELELENAEELKAVYDKMIEDGASEEQIVSALQDLCRAAY
jgi:hypothetical protein